MRLSTIAIAASLFACDQKSEQPSEPMPQIPSASLKTTPAGAQATTPVTPKKPLDTKPLPALEKATGGASGKPMRALGFGGLGMDTPSDLALAPTGELYVCGHFDGELDLGPAGKYKSTPPDPEKDPKKKTKPTSDAFLAKIGTDGKLAWFQRWGAKRDDVARGVAVSGDMIVVVGNYLDELKVGKGPDEPTDKAANSDDLYVAAFDKAGKSLWVYSAGGIDSDGANAVAPAADGGWFVAGSFMRTIKFTDTGPEYKSAGGTDAFLMKLKRGGELEWVHTYGGMYNDTILHLATDKQGSVYIQGHFMDKVDFGAGTPLVAAGGKDNDIVLAKYDANGDHVWSKRFGNQFDDVAGGITVDPAGNVTMVGSFDKSIQFSETDDVHRANGEADIYIARFDPGGKLEWAKTYGGDREDVGWGVASDAAGNTVMTGWFQHKVDFGKTTLGAIESKGNKDVFAIKHDVDGNVVWVQTWGDHDYDQGRAVAIDAKGNAFVTGIFRFTLAVVNPPIESVRAPDDRIPKGDTFVVMLQR